MSRARDAKPKPPAQPVCSCCHIYPAIGRAYRNAAAERDGQAPEPVCRYCAPWGPDRALPLETTP